MLLYCCYLSFRCKPNRKLQSHSHLFHQIQLVPMLPDKYNILDLYLDSISIKLLHHLRFKGFFIFLKKHFNLF